MPRSARSVLVVLALLAGLAATALSAPSDPRGDARMSLWQAAVLGTVEGLTEYLPVSSTGHLLVAQRAMGIGREDADAKEAADAFAICIQLGAILAVLGLYLGRVRQVLRGLAGRDPEGRRLAVALGLAFLPAALVGLLLGDWIKAHLFGPWPVVLAWAVGGAAILLVARLRPARDGGGLGLGDLTPWIALGIGLAQCLAMWPGVSRSLVTIVGGVLAGLSLGAAVEFSFLLGVLTLAAATGHDAVQHADRLTSTYSTSSLVLGLAFAFVSAVLAVRWMVGYLQRHGLVLFGWYRLAAAAVVALLLWRGWL